jgi:hypothetical protein
VDTSLQRRFQIKLTLSAPDDLQVREGDVIVPGQILADRVRDRSRLQFQKEALIREIGRLRKLATLPIPEVRPLPEASFSEEAADIETAKHKADDALRRKEQQQRKIDVLQTMEQSELPESIIPHEQVVLAQRDRELNQALAAVELSQGKLSKAQEQRRIQEYTHSLEMSKRAIAIQEHQLKTQGQIADLEARLSQVEVSLSQLSAVRSPYGGKVQRIKFEGQHDQNLSVQLVLVTHNSSNFGRGQTTPSSLKTDSSNTISGKGDSSHTPTPTPYTPDQ